MAIVYVFMEDLRAMVSVVKYIAELHKKNSRSNARDFKLCSRYANLSQLIAVGFQVMYYSVVVIYQLPAFFGVLTKGTIRPSLHVYLPGVNEFDAIDMSVLLLINVVYSIHNQTIHFASDPFIGINFTTVPMFSTIIQREINELMLRLKDRKARSDFKPNKEQLIDIIEMQIKFNEY